MKVYVVKNPEGKYLTEMMDFADELIFANLFYDVESAWGYAPNDCRAVECFLMERDERKEHDKQVRKEVCEDIRKWCAKNFNWVGDGTGYDGQDYNEMMGANNAINKLRNFLDQIQGEKK